MSLADQLSALHDLHARGLLTDAQFTLAKARTIDAAGAPPIPTATPPPPPPLPVPPPPAPGRPQTPTLNPVVPGVGLALGAAAIANGGLTG